MTNWGSFRLGMEVAEREVLVRLAQGQSPFARAGGGTRGGSARAVKSLIAKGVVADDVSRRYLVDPLFGEWIRAQRRAALTAQSAVGYKAAEWGSSRPAFDP